jgi:hypothetical protein
MTLELYRTRVLAKQVEVCTVLFARSIKPLEGSRPWLRRMRAPMEIEYGETAAWSVAEGVCGARQMAAGVGDGERVSRRPR